MHRISSIAPAKVNCMLDECGRIDMPFDHAASRKRMQHAVRRAAAQDGSSPESHANSR